MEKLKLIKKEPILKSVKIVMDSFTRFEKFLDEIKYELPIETKSNIISRFLEQEIARQLNISGIKARHCKLDSEPDIFLIDYNEPLEVKVTACKNTPWRGSKYSKRHGLFLFISYDRDNLNDVFICLTYIPKLFFNDAGDSYYGDMVSKRNLYDTPIREFLIGDLVPLGKTKNSLRMVRESVI